MRLSIYRRSAPKMGPIVSNELDTDENSSEDLVDLLASVEAIKNYATLAVNSNGKRVIVHVDDISYVEVDEIPKRVQELM
jgi:uncharacterized protein YxeA